MDRYNVQNGRWREKEQAITTIKRIIYTQNKKWEKEYKGGKVTSISTTSSTEPEKKKLKINSSPEDKKKENQEVECILFNSSHKPENIKSKNEKRTTAVKRKTTQPTRKPRNCKESQTNNTPCSNCKRLEYESQEETFKHILAKQEAELWEGFQKTTEEELKKLQVSTQKVKRIPK